MYDVKLIKLNNMKLQRVCKNCNKTIYYKTRWGYEKAERNQNLCHLCSQKIKNKNLNLTRNCPICGKILTYNYKSDWTKANKLNTPCVNCSINSGRFIKGHNLNSPSNPSKYNLNVLLNDSILSYYWIGFIIADGSFYKNTNNRNINGIRFELGLLEKDLNHLQKFGNYINCNNIQYRKLTKSYRLTFSSVSNNVIMSKLGIPFNKTYNPIDSKFISKLSDEQRIAMIIGIIDGDGCILKNGNGIGRIINITSHKNWFGFYKELLLEWNIRFIKNTNCINCGLSKRNKIDELLQFAKNNNLPILERKWNKI